MTSIYDATADPEIKELFESAKCDPYAVLSWISYYDKDYKEPSGVRFTKTFTSDRDYIRIGKYGDEIERIHFDGAHIDGYKIRMLPYDEVKKVYIEGKYELSHNGFNRQIENDQLLELPFIGFDHYYIQNFTGSITVTFIAYTENYRKEICDHYMGCTPPFLFMGVDPKSPDQLNLL